MCLFKENKHNMLTFSPSQQDLSWEPETAFFLESLHPDVQTYCTPHFLKLSPLCNAHRHMDRSTTTLKEAATTQHVHFAVPSTCFPSCPSPTQIRFEMPKLVTWYTKMQSNTVFISKPFPLCLIYCYSF